MIHYVPWLMKGIVNDGLCQGGCLLLTKLMFFQLCDLVEMLVGLVRLASEIFIYSLATK